MLEGLHPALTLLPVPQGEEDKQNTGVLRLQEEPGVEVPAVVSPGYEIWSFLRHHLAF